MSNPPPLAIPGRFGVPNTSGQKVNKACDPCHISKTRCIPDPLSPTNSCKRCSKNGSSCVFSPIGPRRRPVRSKNDRIVELERRVRDMQLRLEKQVEKQVVEKRAAATATATATANTTSTSSSTLGEPGGEADRDAPPGPESFAEAAPTPTPTPGPNSHQHQHPPPHKPAPPFCFAPAPASWALEYAATRPGSESGSHETVGKSRGGSVSCPDTGESCPSTVSDAAADSPEDPKETPQGRGWPDVVDRGLITLSQADKLVKRFRQFIHGRFLGFGIPDGYPTNQSLRRGKPAVWLSVLCAASVGSAEFLSLYPVLSGEMEKLLDDRVGEHLEPDIDAMQALSIFFIFHNDLSQALREKMFQSHNVMISIIVRLGKASSKHNIPDGIPIDEADVTERDLELSRLTLLWHWLSFTVALKARQNVLIRPFHLVSSSRRILETSSTQCDMSLVQWSKLSQVAVDAALALFDGHDRAQGLSDDDRDKIIQNFERKRRQWLINCPFDLVNEFLMLEYHHTALMLTEVIYPAGRADFQLRSHGLPSLTTPAQSPASPGTDCSETKPDQDVLAPYRIDYTKKCIAAAHACLGLVVSPPVSPGMTSTNSLADTETLRYFSNVPYSRLLYALRFLMFVAHDIWRTGKYDAVDIDSLRPGYYIEGVKRVLSIASDGGRFRPPSLWLYAIQTRIQPWWEAFRARLDRDRPPPSRARSSGEVEGTTTGTVRTATPSSPSTTSGTPGGRAHYKTPPPRRQTSEPLPRSSHGRAGVSAFTTAESSVEPPSPAAVPYDIFSASHSMDFLIPFNFVQQAPDVAAADVVPNLHPPLGPVSMTQPDKISSGSGSGGPTSSYPAGACETLPSETSSSLGCSLGADQSIPAGGGGCPDVSNVFAPHGNGVGALDEFLGTMDLDAFNFDWGDYESLFPGAEAFLPDPTVLPPGSTPFLGGASGLEQPKEEDTNGS
ncbi:hypothetical protein KVR01_012544 [Diaporthe batatas]|uniref:uncharacterized protein n=1 Tax=Diaporthe batatas TaxID=748121 RepID=UPI001D045C37|nr:uncharacterized protein KVR01_012544 [Diaporthe batatas]KAG8157502.1 hypothetical protein KVR01_012544 [Diaporthe batatas]